MWLCTLYGIIITTSAVHVLSVFMSVYIQMQLNLDLTLHLHRYYQTHIQNINGMDNLNLVFSLFTGHLSGSLEEILLTDAINSNNTNINS